MKQVVVSSILIIALGASPTGAHHLQASDQTLSHKDPRDVENKLDISRVIFRGHGDGSATLSLRTRRAWGCRYVSGSAVDDGGAASIKWIVNTNRDPYTERDAYFVCDGKSWVLMWGSQRQFEAFKPNRRSLKVRLPLDDLGLDHKKRLAFSAVSFANGVFGHEVFVDESDASPWLAPLKH